MRSRYGSLALSAALIAVCAALALTADAVSWTRESASWMSGAYSAGVLALAAALLPGAVRQERLGLVALLAGQAFWFAVPCLGALASGTWFGSDYGYPLQPASVARAAMLLGLFAAVSWRVYATVPSPDEVGPSTPGRSRWWVLPALFAAGLLPFALYGHSLDAVIVGILASRSQAKAWGHEMLSSNPAYVIGRASLVAAGELALMRALLGPGRLVRVLCWGLAVIAFCVTYLDSGTRSWTLILVLPPLALAVRQARVQGRVRRWIVGLPVVAVLLFALSQAQLAFRGEGASALSSASTDQAFLRDADFFTESAIAIDLADGGTLTYESSVASFVSNPIPRAWWPDKPYPRTIERYGRGKTGDAEEYATGVTRLPSVIGQHYLSWGLVGVLETSLFFGVLLAIVDRQWRASGSNASHLAWATVAVWLFAGFRSLIPGLHYPALLLLALTVGSSKCGSRLTQAH